MTKPTQLNVGLWFYCSSTYAETENHVSTESN